MQRVCSVEGCGPAKRLKRSWCDKHYSRWLKYGEVSGGHYVRYKTPEEAFVARTERHGECLVWVGALNNAGYGQISDKGKVVLAHRYSYERSVGPIPEGRLIDHRCHVRACVEHTHLRLATYTQNQQNSRQVRTDNLSGYTGVTWNKTRLRWQVQVYLAGGRRVGGYYPLHELHVAGYKAKELRNQHYSHNDRDRISSVTP